MLPFVYFINDKSPTISYLDLCLVVHLRRCDDGVHHLGYWLHHGVQVHPTYPYVLDRNLRHVAGRLVLDHYAVSASSQLYQPAMTIYDDKAIPWFISAKYGQVADSQEEAKLWGNVVIRRTHNDDATATMIMYTDELTVYPKQELATTDRPVRILRPGHTTDAIGMRALFGQGQVTLKNKVRGYHEAVGQSS